MAQQVQWRLYIDWNKDGTYTDETARLVQASGSTRIGSPEESISSPRGIVSQMSITLQNTDQRYSVLKTTGALYSQITGGAYYQVPLYLQLKEGTTWTRIFTGVIKNPVETPVIAYKNAGAITFDCRSKEDLVLQKRISTSYATFRQIYNEGWTESQIIAQWLQDAGLTSADYSLDPGLFVLPWAWLDDESPIEDIWQLVAACGGIFYCDRNGILRYENMQKWIGSTTVIETLTKADCAANSMKIDDGELYQAVIVHANRREIQPVGVVWESDDIPAVSPLSSKTIVAQLQQPLFKFESVSYTALTSGSADMSIYVTMADVVENLQAQRATLTFTNSHPTNTIYLHDLQISGQSVSGGPQDDVEKTSSNAFWSNRTGRTRSLRGNTYIQSASQADAIATFLRDRHQLPRVFYSWNGVPGKPTRALGQRVQLKDLDFITGTRQALIVAITWSLSASGYLNNLELMDTETLFPYMNNATNGYFIVGRHALGGTQRVFY